MDNILKKVKIFILIFLSLFITLIIIEISSWYVLKTHWNKKTNVAPNNNYVKIYYDRFHPIWHNNNDLRKRSNLVTFSNIYGMKFNPLSYHWKRYQDFESFIETDKYGFFHNGKIDSNDLIFTNNNKFKIFLVGGSSAAGKGADNNSNTIAANIEKYMNQKFGDKVFVLNAAVFGFTSTQEKLYYEHYLYKFKPDIVIFLHGTNDFYYPAIQKEFSPIDHEMYLTTDLWETYKDPSILFKKFFVSLVDFPQPLYSLNLLSRLGGFNFFKKLVIGGENKSLDDQIYKKEMTFKESSVDFLESNIRTMAHISSKNNFLSIYYLQPNIVMKNHYHELEKEVYKSAEFYYPNFFKVGKKYFSQFNKLYANLHEDLKSNKNIKIINISDMFNDYEEQIYVSTAHYNNMGQKIIAEKISKDLEDIIRNSY